MDINNLVFDKVLRATAFKKGTNEFLYAMTQVQDGSLNGAAEGTDVVDNVGAKIMTLYRAKTAEFSGANAIFDLGLMAAEVGGEKRVGSEQAKVLVPFFETINVVAGTGTYNLKHTPKVAPTEAFKLNGDGSLGTKFVGATEAAADKFSIAEAVLTPPTGFEGELFIMYDYEAIEAVEIVNESNKFPKAVRLVIEALCYDPCDQDTKILCILDCPNAQISNDFDISFAPDGTHPFTYMLQQDYCDTDKRLYRVIVVEDEE